MSKEMNEQEYKHILRSCGVNADGWMCACKRCGKHFGSYKDANNSDCRDTAKMRLRYIEDLECQSNDTHDKIEQLRAENEDLHKNYQDIGSKLNEAMAENEKLKLVIADAHDLSYPGLAVKESTLLNKIYKLTTGYNTEQALNGQEGS